MRIVLALLFMMIAGSPSLAADLSLSLKTPAGEPVRDAVVTFRPASGAPAPRSQGPYVMVQEDIHFRPFVLIVPVGAEVSFPNHDKVRHHVYSFSRAKRFELKLYGHDETRTVRFDKAGVVALGCNIHDTMSAFIDVVETPFAVKTDERGEAVLTDLPAGPGTLTIWHPYLKAPRNEQVHAVTVGGGRQSYVVDLRAAPAAMSMAH